jgi:hypothetical protein
MKTTLSALLSAASQIRYGGEEAMNRILSYWNEN